MKRGRGEEKVMGPMFPRLHVNDTEKGGPRAPPRNKMALYEQLSIPSNRFKSGILPLNNHNTANLISPSPSQRNGHEEGGRFSVQHPPSKLPCEKPRSRIPDSNTPLLPVGSKKKTEGDDFRVPIFDKSNVGQGHGKFYNTMDRENLSPTSPVFSRHSMKDLKEKTGLFAREYRKSQNEENSKQFVASREQCCKATSNLLSMDEPDGVLKQTDVPLHYERGGAPATYNVNCKTDLLRPECRSGSQVGGGTILSEPERDVDYGDSSPCMNDFASEEQNFPNKVIYNRESLEDEAFKSLQGIVDGDDNLSETSMVESISGMGISPDDVAGIIGQNQFWKARRSIVNQQRMFAVQVFELHRLIKVQRLIAGSSNVMFEDNSYLDKPLNISSAKRLPIEYIVRASQNVLRQKNGPEKPYFRMECSAENTVGKASLSCVQQNGSQRSSYDPFSGPPVTNEANMGSWCFNQPLGQQLLIPIMSPSEGLVYKPYPGPQFTTPVGGVCGPPGSIPMMGNYLDPAIHHQYQGMGITFPPPASHVYFPPYSMPVMNPVISSSAINQSNQFADQGLQGQLSGEGANINFQHQNLSSVQSKKNGVVSDIKSHASRGTTDLHASSASSPSERTHRNFVGNTMETQNVLPLFPTSPAVDNPDCSPQPHVTHLARVIKVVPRNARSATESAVRIFQSIQEERKQYD